MALTHKRVRGQDVELVVAKAASGSTALSNWKEFDLTLSISEDDATAAPSEYDQFTPGVKKAEGEVKGFVGLSENQHDLPQPGDELQTIAAETIVGGNSLIADLTGYGDMVVTETNYSQTASPGDYAFKFRSGGILPPTSGT